VLGHLYLRGDPGTRIAPIIQLFGDDAGDCRVS